MHKDIRTDRRPYRVLRDGGRRRRLPELLFQRCPGREPAAHLLPGNEFIIAPEGISCQGNGGYFCEYMFGVDQTSSELSKPEIINRLVMYGAHSGDTNGSICFSDRTNGREAYENIFTEGNAVRSCK